METKRVEVSDNQNDAAFIGIKNGTVLRGLGKWLGLMTTLRVGDIVKIESTFELSIGGKEVEILSIEMAGKISDGVLITVTGYDYPISINWVESLVSRK